MSSKSVSLQNGPLYRIPPYYYIHVLDQNTSVTRLEIGPKIFFKQDNETLTMGPEKMITIPPRHYCIIENPVIKNQTGQIELDKNGQVKLSHGDVAIRLHEDYQEPFPLYPGEILKQPATELKYVAANSAVRLKAILDFDDHGEVRKAGDEWLFEGPGTYIPRKEVTIEERIGATIIGPNQAIKLCAKKELVDRLGQRRVTGENWLVKKPGAYLPLAYETVVNVENAHVLTNKKALHLRALKTFTDDFNQTRNNGDEWLITCEQTEAHILNVYEELIKTVDIVVLNSRQYCVILNPVGADGKNQLGKKKLVVGEKSFFLQPDERLEKGIQDIYILEEDEGLILRCTEPFEDGIDKVSRIAGDRWLLRGPREYIPPTQVEVLLRRKAIALDENEGIYVRDTKTGRARAVIGKTYILTEHEELWEKELPARIESFLEKESLMNRYLSSKDADKKTTKRDRWKVVTYCVPQNDVVQIYDYKIKESRIVFGPDLVMLGPDEQFTYHVIALNEDQLKCVPYLNAMVENAQRFSWRRNQDNAFILDDLIQYSSLKPILSAVHSRSSSHLFTKLPRYVDVFDVLQLYEYMSFDPMPVPSLRPTLGMYIEDLELFSKRRRYVSSPEVQNTAVEFIVAIANGRYEIDNIKTVKIIFDLLVDILHFVSVFGPRLRYHTLVIIENCCPQIFTRDQRAMLLAYRRSLEVLDDTDDCVNVGLTYEYVFERQCNYVMSLDRGWLSKPVLTNVFPLYTRFLGRHFLRPKGRQNKNHCYAIYHYLSSWSPYMLSTCERCITQTILQFPSKLKKAQPLRSCGNLHLWAKMAINANSIEDLPIMELHISGYSLELKHLSYKVKTCLMGCCTTLQNAKNKREKRMTYSGRACHLLKAPAVDKFKNKYNVKLQKYR
ncbi:unnamed protein product [Adineta ricciae]|uniref:Major vault protein n=1 Tax=Adineta ricciae TaxID=249248 RepID=A0A814G290_ADIRI|nr:unnamed protein product [Adineta ricciae]CAF1036306.1 unnamed protein product [Adineta ricciae]